MHDFRILLYPPSWFQSLILLYSDLSDTYVIFDFSVDICIESSAHSGVAVLRVVGAQTRLN